jgi:hypothetical protein
MVSGEHLRVQPLVAAALFFYFLNKKTTSHGIILSISGPQVNSHRINWTVVMRLPLRTKTDEDSTVISHIVITNYFVK